MLQKQSILTMTKQTSCKRCGTCCIKGGPVLHRDDLPLLEKHFLSLDHLIVIRAGEPAYNPIDDCVEPASVEMIKICGKGASWQCVFYDPVQSSCTIHPNRPLECRLLMCWDTKEIVEINGKECLRRNDLVQNDDRLLSYMDTHEKKCSYKVALRHVDHLSDPQLRQEALIQLKTILTEDLAIREEVINRFQLSLQKELFYFGRPMFQVITHPQLDTAQLLGINSRP